MSKGRRKAGLALSTAGRDVRETVKVAVTALVSWLLPFDRLSSAAREMRRIGREQAGGHRIAPIVEGVLSGYVSRQRAYEIDAGWRTRVVEARLQILALHRPGRRSWRPKIQMHGLEHLEAALQKGSGAILWVSDFVYSSLITKIAFHEAGYGVSHLTRREHGFSPTPYGVRVLNPLWTKIEDRFIAERMTIDSDNSDRVLDLLRSRLSANRVVSITVGKWARRTLDLPFFNGKIELASGPVHLSRTSHAPLLPVFTFRSENGDYRVAIGPALDGQTASPGDYTSAISAYVRTLQEYVLLYPDQWNGWMRSIRRD